MAKDHRDLLEVLKTELQFLKLGGYRQTSRAPWRPQFIFQDSPTCLNFDPAHPPRPCQECVISSLVPEQFRGEKVVCRHIPLTEQGETIDFFYRNSSEAQLEAVLRLWLQNEIARLQQERAEGCSNAATTH